MIWYESSSGISVSWHVKEPCGWRDGSVSKYTLIDLLRVFLACACESFSRGRRWQRNKQRSSWHLSWPTRTRPSSTGMYLGVYILVIEFCRGTGRFHILSVRFSFRVEKRCVCARYTGDTRFGGGGGEHDSWACEIHVWKPIYSSYWRWLYLTFRPCRND